MNPIPVSGATLNLTQDCNLRCSYCFTHGKSSRKMTFEMGKKCINYLLKNVQECNINLLPRKYRFVNMAFWGGEPLLEWDMIQQLVLHSENTEYKDVVIEFNGTTNGTLLTEEKLRFCREHQLFFMISLDGTQETHDRYRRFSDGKGSHSVIMKNMEKVLKFFPTTKVRTSPYPDRIGYFYEDIKYLAEHGFYHIMFSPVYEMNWTDEVWEIWKEQCFKVVDLIMYLRKRGIELKLEHFTSFQTDCQIYPCGAGRSYVGFDYDGSIYPCHRFIKFHDDRPWQEKEICIGHVDHGITKPDFRNRFINWNPEDKACKDCKFLDISPCAGGCYGINYDLRGDISIPSPHICNYTKMQKEVSEYLKFCVRSERQDFINEMNKAFSMSKKERKMEVCE